MVDTSKSFDENFQQYYGESFSLTSQQFNEKNALDTLTTKPFIDKLKDFYSYRDGNDFKFEDDSDVIDYFYNDRTWRNYNTGSITKDLLYVTGEDDINRVKQFSEINNVYQNLPNFWDDPNRSFGQWLYDFGGSMILDPANVIGSVVGRKAAVNQYQIELKKLLKGKMAKHMNAEVIKQAQLQANKAAFKSAVARGAVTEGVFSGLVTGAADTMLQHTAIQTGAQDEFSFKRLGISTAYGFGFGTLFGGAFSAGTFKYSLRGQGKNSLKNLDDIHKYGFDELRGDRLFYDLTEVKGKKSLYKNKSTDEVNAIREMVAIKARTTDEHIRELRKNFKSPHKLGKPPKQMFNYDRWAQGNDDDAPVRALRALAEENKKWIKGRVEANDFQSIRETAETLQMNPKELVERVQRFGESDVAAELLAMRMMIKKEGDDLIKLANEMNNVGLTKADKKKYMQEFLVRRSIIIRHLKIQKQAQQTLATALASQRQPVEDAATKAVSLLVNPADGTLGKKLGGNLEAYMKAISKLDDDNHIILALQKAEEVNKWDLAAEYVNNALLSSPDTHLLNLISGFVNMQVRPAEMLLRGLFLAPKDMARAKTVMNEAITTYIYQYVYTADAIKAAYRSFKLGRPVLDSTALKYDSNIRQGQLAAWLRKNIELFAGTGKVGKAAQIAAYIPISLTTLPLRVLSAGDELMKTMSFKARAAAMIDSRIRRDHPEVLEIKGKEGYEQYRALADKYMKEFFTESGQARSTVQGYDNSVKGKGLSPEDKLEVNDPLHYSREITYTQPASSQAQRADGRFTGDVESRVTGWVLRTTANNRWLRALGLHFINTPSNLIRYGLQRFPVLGKYQFQMRQMLKKDPNTNQYINPEAAAEAHARMTMAGLIWSAAVMTAISGKFTPGGDREWKLNQTKQLMTNWQPYSLKDGNRYISMNRLDPFVMPFAVAADLYDAYQKWGRHNEFMPPEVEGQFTEMIVAVLVSLTRNLTSKFYTKGILESANLFMSDGYMHMRDMERIGGSFIARNIFKWIPMSGGLRYVNRVNDEHDRELWTFMDRMRSLNPTDDPNNVMPRRNMLGEKIDRKNGWLFGIGGKEGVWSSPFAMTEFEDTATNRFFEKRNLVYRPPSKIHPATKINLKGLRHPETGQSAYDYWMEQKSLIKRTYKGQKLTLKELIEAVVSDINSPLYKRPEGVRDKDGNIISYEIYGEDKQQNYILSLVSAYESAAFKLMEQEFKILGETEVKMRQDELRFNQEQKDYLKGLKD